MQAAVRLGEDRTEDLSAAVIERGYRLHERQRRVHPERAGIQELPEVHGGEQYHVRQVVGIRGAPAVLCALKSNGPELGTRGLHSEGGGGRGLTARMLSVLNSD